MAHIKIEVTSDWNDCEQCGGGIDYGGTIWIDDKVVWEKVPMGSCYDGEFLDLRDYLSKALEYLGHTVEISYA